MVSLILASAVPPDLSSIITNLGVFSLAVAAVVGGIYKAIREIRKSTSESPTLSATAMMDAQTTQKFLSTFEVLAKAAVEIERHLDKAHDKGQEMRDNVRSSTEEMHRLRVAVTDLHQHMRATNR